MENKNDAVYFDASDRDLRMHGYGMHYSVSGDDEEAFVVASAAGIRAIL